MEDRAGAAADVILFGIGRYGEDIARHLYAALVAVGICGLSGQHCVLRETGSDELALRPVALAFAMP